MMYPFSEISSSHEVITKVYIFVLTYVYQYRLISDHKCLFYWKIHPMKIPLTWFFLLKLTWRYASSNLKGISGGLIFLSSHIVWFKDQVIFSVQCEKVNHFSAESHLHWSPVPWSFTLELRLSLVRGKWYARLKSREPAQITFSTLINHRWVNNRSWTTQPCRFSLHQVHSSQCTKEYYTKYSWRTLTDVCMVSEGLRIVPCCQVLL